jgi:imidazolonepropionase
MTLALNNIGHLVTNDPSIGNGPLGIINNAGLVADDEGNIVWCGPQDQIDQYTEAQPISCDGCAIIPGFVDSHTHIVFAGDRAAEFEARMEGLPYAAGGIQSTMLATRAASDELLSLNAQHLAYEALSSGTTTLEVKSGYGLSVRDEERSMRIARSITTETTFLGAHLYPTDVEQEHYVDLVVGDMLNACLPHAKWIDVFCDRGAFDVDQSREILQAGAKAGLGTRIHANQLQRGGGVQLGVELGVASCDHCTHLTEKDIEALSSANKTTVATLLPAAELCTRSPFPHARHMIEQGVTVALATDCNPGSSYTTSMPFVMSLAVILMGMTPDQALWSSTQGGAQALRRTDIGNLCAGSRADLVVLDAPSHIHLAYRPGVNQTRAVVRGGKCVVGAL